jgi:hypothetical protein
LAPGRKGRRQQEDEEVEMDISVFFHYLLFLLFA